MIFFSSLQAKKNKKPKKSVLLALLRWTFFPCQMCVQQVAHTSSLARLALLYFLTFRTKKGLLFRPHHLPGGGGVSLPRSSASQESLIELVPGPVVAASAKRRTDPAQRLRRGSVKSALLQNSPRASLFLPSSQRHLRRKKAPACQAALNRTACAECKRGGCTSPSSPPSSRGKREAAERAGVDGGGEKGKKKAAAMLRLGCSSCTRQLLREAFQS